MLNDCLLLLLFLIKLINLLFHFMLMVIDFSPQCTCSVNKLVSGETDWTNLYPCMLNSADNRAYFSAVFPDEALKVGDYYYSVSLTSLPSPSTYHYRHQRNHHNQNLNHHHHQHCYFCLI